ncbi:Hypothetical predicted protein [Mytilus galloprovincialis]|uniref:Integrase catalytic domain-containing protein n=1 Tax=Mytilus galloprovincialis TaxID=29158 RepID=A0A8B6HK17_MYTGA|nr:Hypothetical predicted protein [Mytilus galloprovincialis]
MVAEVSIAIAAAKCEVLGEDFGEVTGTWCWIKSSLSNNDQITWMIISSIGWELVSYFVTCIMFLYLKGYMWRQKRRFNQRRFNDVSLRLRAEDENYLYLWLIGYLLRIWGTVRFFLFVSGNSSNDKPFAGIDFALLHLESFGDSSKAFFTFLLFCIADKRTRQLLWNKICCRRRGYEDILQSINAEPNYDNRCNLCARCKRGPGIGKTPLQQSLVGSPFDRIGIDIVGPCPITQDGNEYMIVVQDYFTKWTEVYPVVRHNALTVADKLATKFFCRFGLPSQIHSDQGREFESDLFANLCSLFGIEKTRTCPYRPQSDGLVERMNRTLKQMLSIFANLNRNDWDDHIPYLLMAFRATIQDSIGVSPHKMMFGRDMQCPIDIIAGVPTQNKSETCPVQYIEWLTYTLDLTYSFANENLKKAANRQKKHYDRGVKPRSFSEGEFAWRWYPPRANIKFGLGWIGPYLIKRKITSVTYQIQRDPKSKDIVVHVDHLKPYNGREIPEIWQVQDEQVENEPVYDDTQTLDFLPDDFEDEEINEISHPILDNSFNEREFTVEPVTPPRSTRCGRTVHKPLKYSPSL